MREDYVEWHGWKVLLDNVPLPRPGLYRFKDLSKLGDDKGNYIGISGTRSGIAGRCETHAKGNTHFANAVRKYGRGNFLLTPLLYLTSEVANDLDRTGLKVLEAEYIAEFDAVENGYNVQRSDGMVGPYGSKYAKILKEAYALAMQDSEFRQKFVELGKQWATRTHSVKTPDGKSVAGVKGGKNAIEALRRKGGDKAVKDQQRRGGLASMAEKDVDGKSVHARRAQSKADYSKETFRSTRQSAGRAAAASTHSQKDDQGRSIVGVKWAEWWHSEKDERGKSARAAAAGRNGMASLQSIKDEDGVSHFARIGGQIAMANHGERLRAKALLSIHKKLDAFGRSLAPLKCVHKRDHRDKFDQSCPYCNPEGYVNHPRANMQHKRASTAMEIP